MSNENGNKLTQLAHLTKEQKIELYEAMQEKKRRQRTKKDHFTPNAGQAPVIKSRAMARCNTSGNGAGKTAHAVHEAVWHAQGFNPITNERNKVPTKVVVLIDQSKKSDQIWKPELQKWFDFSEKAYRKNGSPHTQEIQLANGSSILFYSQESDPLSFEGISGYSLVIADEPPPEWQFNALFRGAREKGIRPKFLITGTLVGQNATWIRKLQQRWSEGLEPSWEFFKTSSYVNKDNLADGFLEAFEARLSPAERLVRIEGGASDIEGLALAHLFKRSTHVLPAADFKPHYDMPCVIGIDPHTSKPNVAVLLGVDRNGYYYVVDEICAKKPAREYAQLLKPWLHKYRVIDIVADCSGTADMTGGEAYMSFIEILNEEGIRVRATRGDDKSDEQFITRIQNVLLLPDDPDVFGRRIPALRVLEGCKGLISNIENVSWQRNKSLGINKPKLDIAELDFLAALKYALACNLSPSTGRYYPQRRTWKGKRN